MLLLRKSCASYFRAFCRRRVPQARILAQFGEEFIEELDELATAVAVLDERMHSTSKQIDAGHQDHSAVALVLMVALRGGVGAGNRREIRSGIADRLNTRFLVIREESDLAPPSRSAAAARRISTSR
jgi:hypothetical protein